MDETWDISDLSTADRGSIHVFLALFQHEFQIAPPLLVGGLGPDIQNWVKMTHWIHQILKVRLVLQNHCRQRSEMGGQLAKLGDYSQNLTLQIFWYCVDIVLLVLVVERMLWSWNLHLGPPHLHLLSQRGTECSLRVGSSDLVDISWWRCITACPVKAAIAIATLTTCPPPSPVLPSSSTGFILSPLLIFGGWAFVASWTW